MGNDRVTADVEIEVEKEQLAAWHPVHCTCPLCGDGYRDGERIAHVDWWCE